MNRVKWLYVGLVAFWIVLIFQLSSQPYQQQSIQPLLKRNISQEKLKEMLPRVSIQYTSKVDAHKDPYRFVEFLFRKGAHLTVYAVLALLLALAIADHQRSGLYRVVLVLCVVVAVAALDEWNQSRVVQRTGMPRDVLLDFTGGMIGVVIAAVLRLFRHVPRREA